VNGDGRSQIVAVKKLKWIAGGAILLVIANALLMPALAWTGSSPVRLNLQVKSQSNANVIQGAQIRVMRSDDLIHLGDTNLAVMFRPTMSDDQGSVMLNIQCRAGGGGGLLGKTGRYRIDHELIVEAAGFRTVSAPLANFLGSEKWPLRKKEHDVIVWMTPHRN
jgi:hypothetical protein